MLSQPRHITALISENGAGLHGILFFSWDGQSAPFPCFLRSRSYQMPIQQVFWAYKNLKAFSPRFAICKEKAVVGNFWKRRAKLSHREELAGIEYWQNDLQKEMRDGLIPRRIQSNDGVQRAVASLWFFHRQTAIAKFPKFGGKRFSLAVDTSSGVNAWLWNGFQFKGRKSQAKYQSRS